MITKQAIQCPECGKPATYERETYDEYSPFTNEYVGSTKFEGYMCTSCDWQQLPYNVHEEEDTSDWYE